jgi:DNA replication and repair protein RecF
LYGPNGAGKTNVLEAVSMLSPGRGLRRAAAAEMIRAPEGLGWKVTGTLGDHQLETWVEEGAARSVRIDGKTATQTALGEHLAIVWLTPWMDRLWTEGAEGRRRFLDRMVLGFEPGHGEAVLAYEKAMRERNRLLKDEVRDAHWYRALEAQMAEAGTRIEAARDRVLDRLRGAQAQGETAFPRAGLQLTGPDDRSRLVEKESLMQALETDRRIDMAAGRTLTGPHRTDLEAVYVDKSIAARAASTGEQKALLISLVLANARALRNAGDRPPVLLLDEVAAHLDAGRRAALFAEIAALGAQAWMTGTGAELFQDVAGDPLMCEVCDSGGGSEVREP